MLSVYNNLGSALDIFLFFWGGEGSSETRIQKDGSIKLIIFNNSRRNIPCFIDDLNEK